jgi:hypothetical protein
VRIVNGQPPGDDGVSALAFANTRRRDGGAWIDELDGPGRLEAWLLDGALVVDAVEIGAPEHERFRLLREAVRTVLRARVDRERPDAAAIRTIESAARAAPGAPIGIWGDDGSVCRGWQSTGGDPLDRAAAALAAGVIDLVCGHGEDLSVGVDGGTFRVLRRVGDYAPVTSPDRRTAADAVDKA